LLASVSGVKIIKALDLARQRRAANRTVISGFHTPIEREFLRGLQRPVICPARGLGPFQPPSDWQTKFNRGELLNVSPFDSAIRRPTKETAELRNRLVVEIAPTITLIHAAPGGILETLARA
jgi:hypothetical protein